MTAFVRRFREVPSLEVLRSIEQIALIDRTPRAPVTGVGTGMLMLVGEFEDGPFNTPTEVFGDLDEQGQFGGFGYTYGNAKYNYPCARTHLGETWNGNAFIKGRFLKPPRKACVRVDTSLGTARFYPVASVRSAVGPYRLLVGQQLAFTPDGGGAVTTTAIAAAAAAPTGVTFPGGGANTGFVGGEQIGITIDANTEVVVTFQAADQTAAQVVARINGFLGYAAASVPGTNNLRITGIVAGTAGRVQYRVITAGANTAIGWGAVATSTSGTGNVGDLSAVTATELAALVDALAGVVAVVDAEGRVVAYTTTIATGAISVASSAMGLATGFTPDSVAVSSTATTGPSAIIPAGTRIRRAGGVAITDDRLAMRTISVPLGTTAAPSPAFYDTPVRAALDDGSALAITAGNLTTLIDVPTGRMFVVNNIANISAALTEDVIDVRYETAFNATLDPSKVTGQASNSLSARRSATVNRAGMNNAVLSSNEGCFGRHFHLRAQLGLTQAQALAERALYPVDRVFYTYPAWKVRIPEIAEIGAAGGTGFVDGGVVLVGGDGPLAYLNSALNPEENPGQDTGLLQGFISGIEDTPAPLLMANYVSFKANGICAPRINNEGVPVYQSEVTADLTPGRTTQKRRKFADFLQDSFARILLPYSKQLATDGREAAIDSKMDGFLSGLKSENAPERQRLKEYSLVNTTAQNPDLSADGMSTRQVQVTMLPSMDTFIVDTEIGEGVVVVNVS